MKITIYQIAKEYDKEHLMFCDLRVIKSKNNNTIPAELYKPVYHGNLEAESLEDVFYIFNVAHPKGYIGRSMSVSDVVEVYHSSGKSQFYFCDSVGFQKIWFDKEKAGKK